MTAHLTRALTAKQERAMGLRDQGLTYRAIGDLMGIRPQRASQLVSTVRRKTAPPRDEVETLGLSTRTYTALARAEITTLARLREIADMPSGLAGNVRNFGRGCEAEVLAALAKFGPHCGTCACRQSPQDATR